MKQLIIVLCMFVNVGILHAQTKITGKVTDAQTGAALPFVTVSVKGTSLAISTDDNGFYSIDVPDNATALVYTFVGYAPVEMEISNRSVINITMNSEATSLDEVIVTAMGITREQRAVGYAAQQLKAEDLTTVRQGDLNNALAGKVAGAKFSAASAGTFDAGKIVLRGANTLTNAGASGSAPIYVVDGVITDANAVNMDDVESVNVLKSSAATAIYGSRGGNGAVIITSKKGARDRGQVDFSQTVSFDVMKVPDNYQSLYGGGSKGANGEFNTFNYNPAVHESYLQRMDGMKYYDMGNDESWGPRLDGREYAPWYAWDPSHPKFGQTTKWSPQPENNLKDLYKTGVNSTTNVAFSRSTEKMTTRLSFTNTNRTGVVDNSKAVRRYFSFNTKIDINDRLSVSADYKYTYRKNHNALVEGYSGAGNVTYTYTQWGHRNVNLKDLKDYKRPDGTFRSWNITSPTNLKVAYHDSPWTVYNEIERISTSQWNVIAGNANFDVIKKKLSVGVNFNGNMRYDKYEQKVAVGTNAVPDGRYNTYDSTNPVNPTQAQIMDTQVQGYISFKDKFFDDKLDVFAQLFGETRDYRRERVWAYSQGGLIYNGYWSTGASKSQAAGVTHLRRQQDRSFFGTASFGWDRTYYLELSLRNDWSSTLPDNNNSYLYGSASLAADINRYLPNVTWLDFWKLRGSVAQVGSTMDPYQVYETYASSAKYEELSAMSMSTRELNLGIKPTISTSWEIGTEFKMFKNRLWGDINYYVKNTKNQIINLPVAPTSGYSTKKMNAGVIQNKGIEVSLGGSPIVTKDFEWSLYVNIAKNVNKLKELDKNNPDMTRYQLDYYGLSTRLYLYAEVGEPLGTIRGTSVKVDENSGQRVYTRNNNGDIIPVLLTSDQKDFGSIQPDATGGFGTSVTWKGITLSAGFDFQIGGKIASVTNMYGEGSGLLKHTAATNDRGVNIREPVADGGGIKLSGVFQNSDGTYTPFTEYSNPQSYYAQVRRVWEDYVYDASYLTIRELSVSYSIPRKLIEKLNIGLNNASVAFVAQNPWLIHSGVPNVDASLVGNARYGFIEQGQAFGARTFGFTVNLTF